MKVSVGHDGLTDEDSPAGVQHCLAPWAQPKPWSPPRPACRGDWDMLTHPGGPCPFTRHPEEPFLGRPGFMGEPGQASQVRNWGFKSDRRRVRSAPATRLQPVPAAWVPREGPCSLPVSFPIIPLPLSLSSWTQPVTSGFPENRGGVSLPAGLSIIVPAASVLAPPFYQHLCSFVPCFFR